jgi:hypothetical protein
MKHLPLALSLLLLCPTTGRCQSPYLRSFPFHLDERIIRSFQDSLKRERRSSRFITFLTHEREQDITYFMWTENNQLRVVQLTDSTISTPLACPQPRFLAALDLPRLAVRQSEDRLRFMPPLNPQANNSALVEMAGRRYLIQQGVSSNYVLDKTKNHARAAFFRQLVEALAPLQGHWHVARAYERYPKE